MSKKTRKAEQEKEVAKSTAGKAKKTSEKAEEAGEEPKSNAKEAESKARMAMQAAKEAKEEWTKANDAYLLAVEKKKSEAKIEKAKKERKDAKINANNAVEAANKAKKEWDAVKMYEATTAKSMRVDEAKMPGGQEGSDEETAKGSKGKKRTPADSGIVKADESKPKKAKKSKET